MNDPRPDNLPAPPGIAPPPADDAEANTADAFAAALATELAPPAPAEAPAPIPAPTPAPAPAPAPAPMPTPAPPPAPGKPPRTKKALIVDIKEAQAAAQVLGVTSPDATRKSLSRMSIADLRALHGRLCAPAPAAAPALPAGGTADGLVMEKLLNGAMCLSTLAASLTETAVNGTSDYSGLEMEGYAAEIARHEEPLKGAFRAILEEEGSAGALGQALGYLDTPYAQLGLVFAAAGAGCLKTKKTGPASVSSSPSFAPPSSSSSA